MAAEVKYLPCDKQHYQCGWTHRWDGERTAAWVFGTLVFIAAAFLMVWVGTMIWTHSVGAKPKSIEQQKQDQAVEQMHINECTKIGAYWNGMNGNCEKP